MRKSCKKCYYLFSGSSQAINNFALKYDISPQRLSIDNVLSLSQRNPKEGTAKETRQLKHDALQAALKAVEIAIAAKKLEDPSYYTMIFGDDVMTVLISYKERILDRLKASDLQMPKSWRSYIAPASVATACVGAACYLNKNEETSGMLSGYLAKIAEYTPSFLKAIPSVTELKIDETMTHA